MSLRERARDDRYAAIMKFCADVPKTAREIATGTGLNYFTTYKDLEQLVKSDRCSQGLPRDRSATFIARPKRAMPSIYNSHVKSSSTLVSIVERVATSGWTSESRTTEAAGLFPRIFAEILELARFAAEQGPDSETDKQLAKLRNDLVKCQSLLASAAGMCNQVLNHEPLWSSSTAAAVGQDAEFPADYRVRVYESMLLATQPA